MKIKELFRYEKDKKIKCKRCNDKGGKYIERRFGCFDSEEYLPCIKCGK